VQSPSVLLSFSLPQLTALSIQPVALVVAIIHLGFSFLCSVSFAMIVVAGIILPIAIKNRIFARVHLYTGCDLLQGYP